MSTAATVTTTAAAMEPTTTATTVESATAEATASTVEATASSVEATASTVEAAHAAAVTASEPIAMESAGAAAAEAARIAAAEAVIAVADRSAAIAYSTAAISMSIPEAASVAITSAIETSAIEAAMPVAAATVESMTPIAVVPRPRPDEEAAEEPARAIEAVRCAGIRIISVVAIRADRSRPVIISGTVIRTVVLIVVATIANTHLCLGAWSQRQWRGHEAQREYPSKKLLHIASPIQPPLLLLTEWPSWCVGKPAVSAESPNQ